MIGIDTNVLVRYFVQDDPAQSAIAIRFMRSLSRETPGYITIVVLVELVWALSSGYKEKRDDIADVLQGILVAEDLVVQNAASTYRALHLYRKAKVDFADALIAVEASLASCAETVTFDRAAATGLGMRLLS